MKERIVILMVMMLCTGAGTAYSQDVSRVKNNNPCVPNDTLRVVIQTDSIGEPISPYTYGQFIEHQGRCIYGGIWAEMVKDRKFFYPIDALAPGDTVMKSPWHITPAGSNITMDTTFIFAGKHHPRINLDGQPPCGILQDSIALRPGKEYTGHIVLAGGDSVVVMVSLSWGPNPSDQQTIVIDRLAPMYGSTSLRFAPQASTDNGRLQIIGQGHGPVHIGAISLMPSDNIKGMRADVIYLLSRLRATVYRWPGGTFVNGYDWRNAIGDRDRRAPKVNRVYGPEQIESYDFGPDEFMTLVRELSSEAYVAVSARDSGDAQMAADEVEYFNGASNTPMGALRAGNGHPDPYNVRFWGVGNEAYFYAMPSKYTGIHNTVTQAMRVVDPDITVVAVGGYKCSGPAASEGEWSELMLVGCADYMDLISEHDYMMPMDDLIRHTRMLAIGIDSFAVAHRRYRQQLSSLQGKDIRLAIDEWNYIWFGKPYLYGDCGVRYYFRDALGFGSALNALTRNSDIVYMANTQPVNVHGSIKTTNADAAFEVTALPLIIYRNHFGTLPITVSGNTDTIDVAAAWSDDKKFITVAIVNPTVQLRLVNLDLENAQLTGPGRWWQVISPDPWAYNEPGYPPKVVIEEGEQASLSPVLHVPPLSFILYELPAKSSTSSSLVPNRGIPDEFRLEQNYPNPFNPSTIIKYELPKFSMVRLSIYDMLGREVSVLVNERKDAGVYQVEFDAFRFSSGVYLYRLQTGDFIESRKMLVLK